MSQNSKYDHYAQTEFPEQVPVEGANATEQNFSLSNYLNWIRKRRRVLYYATAINIVFILLGSFVDWRLQQIVGLISIINFFVAQNAWHKDRRIRHRTNAYTSHQVGEVYRSEIMLRRDVVITVVVNMLLMIFSGMYLANSFGIFRD